MPQDSTSEELKQIEIILPHLIRHNGEHAREMRSWVQKARKAGAVGAARDLAKSVGAMNRVGGSLRAALRKVKATQR